MHFPPLSPSYKLKVDEMDFQQDKKWNIDTPTEVIEEEKTEDDKNENAQK